MSSQIGAILPAVETLVHVDGAGVVPPKGDLLVASGRHVFGGDWRRPTPAHNAQRIFSDGTGCSASGRYLEVRTIVPILGLTTGIMTPATNVALFCGDAANVVVNAGTNLAKLDTIGWTGLSLVILAPAHCLAIAMETARVGLSGRYLNKGTGISGRVRLGVVVRTPTKDAAADGLDATDVISPAAELNEGLVFGRRGDAAPARNGTGGSHGAAVGGTGGDLLEDAKGGVRLALLVVTKTADTATSTGNAIPTGQGAGKVVSCAHGGFVVRTGGWTLVYRKAPSNRLIDKTAPPSTTGLSGGGIASLSGGGIVSLVLINPATSTTPRTNGAGLPRAAEKAK